jgi:transposase
MPDPPRTRRATRPQSRTLDSGLDGHPESIAVADVAKDQGADVICLGAIGTRHVDRDQFSRQGQLHATHLGLVYDAGPWGDGRSRDVPQTGDEGGVVAPARIPHQAGDRMTPDRRDAVQRARLMRSGELPPVEVSKVDAAASRDLTRAREETSGAPTAAKFRRNAFLLRHDIR